jgi:hypothetical protein
VNIRAVLEALSFEGRSTRELESIPANAWPALLATLDRSHLTLALGTRCRDSLPDFVRERIDRNLASNAVRHERLVETQREICESMRRSRIPFVVLKGLAHSSWTSDDPRTRPQYDIDIYVPHELMPAALATLRDIDPPNGLEVAWRLLRSRYASFPRTALPLLESGKNALRRG